MSAPPVTLVTCVEAGALETMALRMIASLRRWGGRFADCPVVAVTPRFGPPVARATRRRLADLGARYVRRMRPTRYAWTIYLNKLLSLRLAEEHADTPFLGWLDADILVVGEPGEWAFRPDDDLLACPTDLGGIGSTGPGSPNEPYWEALCNALDVPLNGLPWVTTCREGRRIRLYFNAGHFLYRRDTGFTDKLLGAYEKALDARIAHRVLKVHFTEQMCLGLAAHRHGLRWRALPHSHNYGISYVASSTFSRDLVAAARLLHYHEAMTPARWPSFLGLLRDTHPEVHAWLAPLGPVEDPTPLRWKGLAKLLQTVRGLQRRVYWSTCALH